MRLTTLKKVRDDFPWLWDMVSYWEPEKFYWAGARTGPNKEPMLFATRDDCNNRDAFNCFIEVRLHMTDSFGIEEVRKLDFPQSLEEGNISVHKAISNAIAEDEVIHHIAIMTIQTNLACMLVIRPYKGQTLADWARSLGK